MRRPRWWWKLPVTLGLSFLIYGLTVYLGSLLASDWGWQGTLPVARLVGTGLLAFVAWTLGREW